MSVVVEGDKIEEYMIDDVETGIHRYCAIQYSSENTIILFVCPPKFCISIVFVFPWDHGKYQEKQCLGKICRNKQRALWYFPKWPMGC